MRSLVGDYSLARTDARILRFFIARWIMCYVPDCIAFVRVGVSPYNMIDAFFDTPVVGVKIPPSDLPPLIRVVSGPTHGIVITSGVSLH